MKNLFKQNIIQRNDNISVDCSVNVLQIKVLNNFLRFICIIKHNRTWKQQNFGAVFRYNIIKQESLIKPISLSGPESNWLADVPTCQKGNQRVDKWIEKLGAYDRDSTVIISTGSP